LLQHSALGDITSSYTHSCCHHKRLCRGIARAASKLHYHQLESTTNSTTNDGKFSGTICIKLVQRPKLGEAGRLQSCEFFISFRFTKQFTFVLFLSFSLYLDLPLVHLLLLLLVLFFFTFYFTHTHAQIH
jgi:hypothetical protein